jgi:ribonuclease BN (tRNA processing enzyme)
VELGREADVLIHDAQHTAEEFPPVAGFGHAAIEYAVGLARVCDVGRLLLFHHSPTRTDDELDAIVAAHHGGPLDVCAAAEETVLDLP